VIIGGGAAGLMAADVLSARGYSVLLAEHKPSLGRKFLMAGKSGLNLTKAEDAETFVTRYDSDWMDPMLRAFGPKKVQTWAQDLGQPLFTGSTGRVFPQSMKASPLLRAWIARLRAQGTEIRTRWRFAGWDDRIAVFETPEGLQHVASAVTVLAMGGGSWRRLGSDGGWAELPELARYASAFLPSNTGLRVDWTDHMAPHFGKPLKAVRWSVHDGREERATSRGEAIISERGLEGGGLYPLIPVLRQCPTLIVDLAPDLTISRLTERLPKTPKGETRMLRNLLRWPAEKIAVFQEFKPRDGLRTSQEYARTIKAVRVRHAGPRPLDEAISTAGGLRRDALTEHLEFRDRRGVFACGEMLDWDAPTGGYLITACLASGRWAGLAAAAHLAEHKAASAERC